VNGEADAEATAAAKGEGDVAAMRRELDELKQAVRESLQPRGRRKKKS
jgi:hypothetical protein